MSESSCQEQTLHRFNHLLVEFYEKLSSWEHGVVRGKGITLPQMHTLEIIGHNNPIRMKELAEKMGVTTGTVTVAVDKLEKMDMVQRIPNPSDRRSYLVELTALGGESFAEHDAMHIRLTQELAGCLTEEETVHFTMLLEKINTAF